MANACGRTRGSLRDPTPAKKRPQNLTAAFWRPRRVARQFGARRRIVIGGIHSRREMIKWNQKGRHDLRRVFLFGAGYGNRTRLLGLGSRCTTDVLILLMNFLLALCASYGNPSAARPPSCPAHFLVALPKAAMLRIPAVCRRLNACARTAVPVWSADHYRCTNPVLPLSYHLFRKNATAI